MIGENGSRTRAAVQLSAAPNGMARPGTKAADSTEPRMTSSRSSLHVASKASGIQTWRSYQLSV